jgi:hypothetical protein
MMGCGIVLGNEQKSHSFSLKPSASLTSSAVVCKDFLAGRRSRFCPGARAGKLERGDEEYILQRIRRAAGGGRPLKPPESHPTPVEGGNVSGMSEISVMVPVSSQSVFLPVVM